MKIRFIVLTSLALSLSLWFFGYRCDAETLKEQLLDAANNRNPYLFFFHLRNASKDTINQEEFLSVIEKALDPTLHDCFVKKALVFYDHIFPESRMSQYIDPKSGSLTPNGLETILDIGKRSGKYSEVPYGFVSNDEALLAGISKVRAEGKSRKFGFFLNHQGGAHWSMILLDVGAASCNVFVFDAAQTQVATDLVEKMAAPDQPLSKECHFQLIDDPRFKRQQDTMSCSMFAAHDFEYVTTCPSCLDRLVLSPVLMQLGQSLTAINRFLEKEPVSEVKAQLEGILRSSQLTIPSVPDNIFETFSNELAQAVDESIPIPEGLHPIRAGKFRMQRAQRYGAVLKNANSECEIRPAPENPYYPRKPKIINPLARKKYSDALKVLLKHTMEPLSVPAVVAPSVPLSTVSGPED